MYLTENAANGSCVKLKGFDVQGEPGGFEDCEL